MKRDDYNFNEQEENKCSLFEDSELSNRVKDVTEKCKQEKNTYLSILSKGIKVLIKGSVKMMKSQNLIDEEDE